MSKDAAIASLNDLEKSLKQLKAVVQKTVTPRITKASTKKMASTIATQWFEKIEQSLPRFNLSDTVAKKFHEKFDDLLRLSMSNACKNPYLKAIDFILENIRRDILVPIMKASDRIYSFENLSAILENATETEKEYLNEALGCANSGYFRASVVLGWNAAIDRIHRVIEKLGLDTFNQKSEEMKRISEGRFKRFNKSFNVQSLSDLNASVFDNDLLWVLEYWVLIDSNQHDRLSTCFTMRNNCAHPGEAPLTKDNLASFYSDLKAIIFDNPKFRL